MNLRGLYRNYLEVTNVSRSELRLQRCPQRHNRDLTQLRLLSIALLLTSVYERELSSYSLLIMIHTHSFIQTIEEEAFLHTSRVQTDLPQNTLYYRCFGIIKLFTNNTI